MSVDQSPAERVSTVVDGVDVLGALSPSRAADFMACPLLYRFRTVDRLPEPYSPDAVRGSVVHKVLEVLFDLPAVDRTPEQARELLVPAWEAMLEEDEFADAFDALETLAASLDDEVPPEARLERGEREALIDQMTVDVADMHEFFRPFRKAGTTPRAMRVETVRREQPKVGRNDPCPCGSGRKFKLCCGR